MFGLTKISEDIYLIVKRDAIEEQFDLPNETPFETYGIITSENGFFTIITKTPEVFEEKYELFALIINQYN